MTKVSNAQHQKLTLLRALARPGAVARWSKVGDGNGLSLTAAGAAGPLQAPANIAREVLSAGLIAVCATTPDEVVLTAAGRAWLRRQLASDDPFLVQHREMRSVICPAAIGAKQPEPMQVNDAESPLAWLRRRKDRNGAPILDDKQFEAGERLRQDYTFAALGPRVTANWSNLAPSDRQRRASTPASAMRDDVIAAKARVARAIAAAGPELGRMLIDVCCLLKGIEAAESGQGLPQRSGKVVLQLALTTLARHYGLLSPPPAPRDSLHILHWGDADYRPALSTDPPP